MQKIKLKKLNSSFSVGDTLTRSWYRFKKVWGICLVMIFLYFPLIYLVAYSFSSGRTLTNFGSATLDNYENLFTNLAFGQALSTTLYVSIFSTIASVFVGTMAAAALMKVKRWLRAPIMGISKIPIAAPDTIIGLSLFLLFTAINVPLGTFTLILSHIAFSAPYVLIVMYPRMRKLDYEQIYASYDLGAKKLRTFFHVTLPQLYAPLFSATVIAFVMSFDDFVISLFTSGVENNISTYLFSLKRPSFIINSFSTLFLLVLTIIVLSSSYAKHRKDKKIYGKK